MTIPAGGRRATSAIFLDVDGTYAHHGIPPAAHVQVVRAARAAGHRVLLCTGRPMSMLSPRLLAAGFDGVVASAGAYVELDGQVLADLRFAPDLAARTLAVLDAHDVAYLLEAPEAVYGPPGIGARLADLFVRRRAWGRPSVADPAVDAAHGSRPTPDPARSAQRPGGEADVVALLRELPDLSGVGVGKVTYFDAPLSGPELVRAIGPGIAVLPSSVPEMGATAGELYQAGLHKAIGIDVVRRHLGLAARDVVAFGDGLNDLEMLAAAGVGVAIEGADPRLLAVADRVAAGPERAGLVAAFAELGLV